MFQFFCIDCSVNRKLFKEIRVKRENHTKDNQRGVNKTIKKIQNLDENIM